MRNGPSASEENEKRPAPSPEESALFRELIERTPEFLYAKNLDGRFTFANQALARRLGCANPEDVIGLSDQDFFSPDVAASLRADELRIFEHGESILDQLELHSHSGAPEVWTLTTKIPLRNEQGEIIGLVGSSRDVTKRKRAERKLVESESRFQALARYANDIVAILEVDGSVRYVGPSLERVMGYKPGDLQGTSAFTFDHPDDLPRIHQWFTNLLNSTAETISIDVRVRHANGSWRWFEVVGTNLIHEAAIKGLVVNARDITERRNVEDALRMRDRAISAVTDGIIIVDAALPDMPIIDVNAAFERITGYTAPEVINRNCRFLNGALTDPGAVATMRHAIEHGTECEVRLRNYRKDGSTFWSEVRLSPVIDDEGNRTHIVGILTDVTERVWVDEELHFQGELLNQATAAVIATDSNGKITHWNRHAEKTFGWTAAEAIGQQVPSATFGPILPEVIEQIGNHVLRGNPWEGEFEALCKGGTTIFVQCSIAPVNDSQGNRVGIVNVAINVNERRELQERLSRLAYFDTLTGLPNRTRFLECLQDELALGRNPTVLFIDLDRFRVVNDSLGHSAGNELLIQVAKRFQRILRPGDILARFGGDEFAVLLDGSVVNPDADLIASRLIAVLHAPFELEGREGFSGASIGIAVGSSQNKNADSVIRDAEIALYQAKKNGGGRWAHFAGEIGARVAHRMQLETELRHALMRDEFEIHYQPVIDLGSNTIRGFEALVRWRHPVRGLVSPAEFIPIAEETGMIIPLGEWVLLGACRQTAKWLTLLPDDPLVISVNISPRQFQGSSFGHALWRVLGETNLLPGRLKLEVTEEALTQDAESAGIFLRSLKTVGVKLALDDFGTAYSSLGRLHTLPLDDLKIDRSFTAALGSDIRASAIVKAIVTLGHELGLIVTAEGIETDEQRRIARDLGCDSGQGFLFSRALLPEDATNLLIQTNQSSEAAVSGRRRSVR